jgi:hypothetical protein
MSSSNELRLLSTKWLTYSILGLALFSAGILVLMEAIVLRINGKDLFTWGWVLVVAELIRKYFNRTPTHYPDCNPKEADEIPSQDTSTF